VGVLLAKVEHPKGFDNPQGQNPIFARELVERHGAYIGEVGFERDARSYIRILIDEHAHPGWISGIQQLTKPEMTANLPSRFHSTIGLWISLRWLSAFVNPGPCYTRIL
jgi:hypothetical protein